MEATQRHGCARCSKSSAFLQSQSLELSLLERLEAAAPSTGGSGAGPSSNVEDVEVEVLGEKTGAEALAERNAELLSQAIDLEDSD